MERDNNSNSKVSLWDNLITYSRIMENVEMNEGVLSEELEKELDIVETNLEDKLRAYKNIINTHKATTEMLKEEIENYTNKIKTSTNIIKRLKDNVYCALVTFGNNNGKTFSKKYTDFTVYTKDSDALKYNTDKFDNILRDINEYPDEINKIATAQVTVRVPLKDVKYLTFDYDGDFEVEIKPLISNTKCRELLNEQETLKNTKSNDGLLNRINKIVSELEIRKETTQSVIFR